MKIGELSKRTGCPVETIRFYEREGLLPPASRSQGNYRVYRDADAERLSFIVHCRWLDMTLDEIRALLRFRESPDEDCGQVNALLDNHIDELAGRIARLNELEKQLRMLRGLCRKAEAMRECRILNQLTQGKPRP